MDVIEKNWNENISNFVLLEEKKKEMKIFRY